MLKRVFLVVSVLSLIFQEGLAFRPSARRAAIADTRTLLRPAGTRLQLLCLRGEDAEKLVGSLTEVPMEMMTGAAASDGDGVARAQSEWQQALALKARNAAFLTKFRLAPETVAMIVGDVRIADTADGQPGLDLEARAKELRQETGLTRATLKMYLQRYPSIVVDMFTSPVKSSKSVTMRMLGLSEAEYLAGRSKVGSQTHNKPGTLFRGSLPLIVASLKDSAMVGLSREDMRRVFSYYPTLFTLDEGYLARRLRHLREVCGYSAPQLRRMLLSNPRALLYDQDRYQELKGFFEKSVGLSSDEFCELTSQPTGSRLITASHNTIASKTSHLTNTDTWGLSRRTLRELVVAFPTIMTTPVDTTARLWTYLHDVLHISPDNIRQCAVKYPGFLRSNPTSLTRKLEYMVAFQALLQAMLLEWSADGGSGSGSGSGFFSTEEELVLAVEQVLVQVAALLMSQVSIIFTFSDARIASRLLEVAAVKHGEVVSAGMSGATTNGDECGGRNVEARARAGASILETRLAMVAEHVRRQQSMLIHSPPWPATAPATSTVAAAAAEQNAGAGAAAAGGTGGGVGGGETASYRHLARALVHVAGSSACALLVLEAASVRNVVGDRGKLSRLLPVSPQQAVTYSRSKFDRWLTVSSSSSSAADGHSGDGDED